MDQKIIEEARKKATNEKGEINYALLSGIYEGIFESMKFYKDANDWQKAVEK